MDYFKQRRAYRKLLTDELALSLGQNMLYRELLDYANDEGKMDCQFRLRNSALESRTSLTKQGLTQARNRLVQEGLIKYTPGKKDKTAPTYQLIQLYKDFSKKDDQSLPSSLPNSSPRRYPVVDHAVATSVDHAVDHKNLLRLDNDSKRDSPHSRKREYADDSPELSAATYLWEQIKGNNPDHKKPDLQKWANDIRKMHEIDKRPFEKINKMIDWCQRDAFWQTNILSAAKLRSKYDTMAAQANRKYVSTSKPQRIEKDPEWLKPDYQPPKHRVTDEQRKALAEQRKQLQALGKEKQEG